MMIDGRAFVVFVWLVTWSRNDEEFKEVDIVHQNRSLRNMLAPAKLSSDD
jgi:hypothetical protein